MSLLALALVLTAAVAHAGWNLLAKTAAGGATFVWLCAAAGTAIYVPALAVAAVVAPGRVDAVAVGFMAGSGALHALYFVLLQRGYRDGELSLVYPLARGTGPVLSTGVAVALLGERPSGLALAGAAAIVAAVLALAGPLRALVRGEGAGARFALLTGAAIAGYTLWDKHAVGPLGLSPVVYYWGTNLANALLLSPWVLRRPAAVAAAWRAYRRQVLGVGLLSPLAYLLVLFALARAPVSYVAPAREVSILLGAALGAHVLREGDARRRLLSAAAIVGGITALALG
jgi:drug/metabolite transporter (DMT)-like permease